jgi:hypothetical protein
MLLSQNYIACTLAVPHFLYFQKFFFPVQALICFFMSDCSEIENLAGPSKIMFSPT